jgi:hypothetical protein
VLGFRSQDNVFLTRVVEIRGDLETEVKGLAFALFSKELTCVSEKPEGALGKVRFGSASCQIAVPDQFFLPRNL